MTPLYSGLRLVRTHLKGLISETRLEIERHMDLTIRPFESADTPFCTKLLRPRVAYLPAVLAELPRVWSRWLEEDAMTAVVVEDHAQTSRQNIVGFAVGVFIDDAWLDTAMSAAEPYLSARTIAAELKHKVSPVLRPREIGRENGRNGLNILNLHYCEAPGLSVEMSLGLRFRLMTAFLEGFRGYNVKAVVQEFWDEISHEFIVNGWGAVINDYSDYYAAQGQSAPEPGRRPYLVATDRDRARSHPGDQTAILFQNATARFSFTRTHKKILREALHGKTDTDLATRFGIALATIKSHWRSIYGEISARAAELFPDTAKDGGRGARRGQEKRRQLLEYLRRHPEELCLGVNERRSPRPTARDSSARSNGTGRK